MGPLTSRHPMRYLAFVTAVGAVGLVVENPYYFQILTMIGIHTLLALALNLLMGYAGQISLGHAAFYGLGAYASAVLTTRFGLSPWAALPCSMGTAGLVALFVGYPTLKLTGYYLGMGTLGIGMIVFIVFREWAAVTGGASGFVGIPPLSIAGVDLVDGRRYFFLVWAVVTLGLAACQRLIASRVGRALRSIHDSEAAARAVGVPTAGLKLQVFVLSAVMSSVAGFLYAHMVGFISPDTFSFLVSVKLVTMVVIGGMASVWGALLGAALLTLLPEALHAFADFEMVVYGLILMTVMIFLPQGLTRGLLDLYAHRRRHAEGSARAGD